MLNSRHKGQVAPRSPTAYCGSFAGRTNRPAPELDSRLTLATQAITANLLGEWYGRVNAAKPFLKWAGGKFLFLTRYGNLIPPFEGRYFEPFLGSGATFFHVQRRLGRPVDSVLGDLNAQLVRMYVEVKERPEEVAAALAAVQEDYDAAEDKSVFYYEVRERYNEALPSPAAADFIFLNRTCW